jgi:hypothetical protein
VVLAADISLTLPPPSPRQDELLLRNYHGSWVLYHFRTLLRELFR